MTQVMQSRDSLGSSVFREGMAPQTWSKTSHRIKVFSYLWGDKGGKFSKMGIVSKFTPPSDSRTMTHIHGIGSGDQVAEIVPGASADYTLSFDKFALWLENSHQILGYAGGADGLVRALKHHRYPFDLKQEEVWSTLASKLYDGSAEGVLDATDPDDATQSLKALITYYETCWVQSFSYSVDYGTAEIAESVTCNVTDIVPHVKSPILPGLDTGNSTVGGLGAEMQRTVFG